MEAVTGMSAILSTVGSVVTASIGWLSDFCGALTTSGNEILLLFAVIPCVGLGVGLLKRLINL